ncbi:Segregation and condensation protein A [Polystyrenella longa]|uniref:Segregation and condensation protein A n=1 Tax=Polystyrenella longa TaxID=2528007 RepID=A0A518CPB7_9PLAN|nr:segregation/condensation protein A [Polystyrenella longa]QDU81077.1 Segregation and condensation protein A [Polystyrenella longa]
MEAGYRVKLDLYSGPLELLLYLVRRNEVDILELPIAAITNQFLEYLEVLIMIDIDEIGEFLVTASTIIELKSRQVLPRPEEEVEEEETELEHEMSSALVARLLEYKRFKDASQLLQEKAAIWQERYSRLHSERPRRGRKPSDDLIKEVELWDLVSALSRLLRVKQVDTKGKIKYDDTPISVFMQRIRDQVIEAGEMKFSDFFEGIKDRSRITGIFLAILELLRHHQFRARQSLEYGDITILPPLEGSAVLDAPLESSFEEPVAKEETDNEISDDDEADDTAA